MEINRAGSQPSGKGPSDWLTGMVRIDLPAMNERESIKAMVRPESPVQRTPPAGADPPGSEIVGS